MADDWQRPTGGVIPHLFIKGGVAAEAVELYKKAFGAVEEGRMMADDGKRIMHTSLKINGGTLFLCDEFPEHGVFRPIGGFNLHLQVPDAYVLEKQANAAGIESKMPVQTMFWGDDYGQLRDPYGVDWSLASAKKR